MGRSSNATTVMDGYVVSVYQRNTRIRNSNSWHNHRSAGTVHHALRWRETNSRQQQQPIGFIEQDAHDIYVKNGQGNVTAAHTSRAQSRQNRFRWPTAETGYDKFSPSRGKGRGGSTPATTKQNHRRHLSMVETTEELPNKSQKIFRVMQQATGQARDQDHFTDVLTDRIACGVLGAVCSQQL